MYSVTNELNTEDCDFDIPAGMRPQIKYCLVLPCLAWPKLAFLAGNTFSRGMLFTWANRESPRAKLVHTQKCGKKETCKIWWLHFVIFQLRVSKLNLTTTAATTITTNNNSIDQQKHQLNTCITLCLFVCCSCYRRPHGPWKLPIFEKKGFFEHSKS